MELLHADVEKAATGDAEDTVKELCEKSPGTDSLINLSGSSASQLGHSAHTEQKDHDLDCETLGQGISTGANESQEHCVVKCPTQQSEAATGFGEELDGHANSHFQPTEPTESRGPTATPDFYDDGLKIAGELSFSTEYSDSNNELPVNKKPVQEDEKSICAEELLGDFEDDCPPTSEFKLVTEFKAAASTTDIDDDFELPLQTAKTVAPTPQSEVDDLKDMQVISEETPVPPVVEQAPPSAEPTPGSEPTAVSKNAEPTISDNCSKERSYDWLHPSVESLIYWHDIKQSGFVFGTSLVTLLAIAYFSVVSIFAYLSLLLFLGTLVFRFYESVMQYIELTLDEHPFRSTFEEYLEVSLTLPEEKLQHIVANAVVYLNGFTAELRRLFLTKDPVLSFKFCFILWVMTYIGAWFNGTTLLILALVSLFTVPKMYEKHKQAIGTLPASIRNKLTGIRNTIKMVIPIGKQPMGVETPKDK